MGAGYFGPKTRKALKTKSENFNSRVVKEQKRLQGNVSSLVVGLGKNATGDDVYNLKQMLWELGYYKGTLDGEYDIPLMYSVFEFQKANNILNSEWERGAGYYGKKTHIALAAAVDRKIEKLTKYPVEMQVWVPAKVDLPKLETLTIPDGIIKRKLSFDLNLIDK